MFRFALYVLSILVLAIQTQADTPLPLQGSAPYQRLGNDVYLASLFSASADEQQGRQPGTVVAVAATAKPVVAERKPADIVVKAAEAGTAHADESPAVAGQLASARYLRSLLRHANSKAVYPERAAVRAAKQAAPYPQPPAVLTADTLEFDLPFRFALAH